MRLRQSAVLLITCLSIPAVLVFRAHAETPDASSAGVKPRSEDRGELLDVRFDDEGGAAPSETPDPRENERTATEAAEAAPADEGSTEASSTDGGDLKTKREASLPDGGRAGRQREDGGRAASSPPVGDPAPSVWPRAPAPELPSGGSGNADKPTYASPISPSASEPRARLRNIATEGELGAHLESRSAFARAGEEASADVELALAMDVRQAIGARNVLTLSHALIHEATRAAAEGRMERAIDLAEKAAKASPDLAQAHWLRARLHAAENWAHIDLIAASMLDLLEAELTRFRNVVILMSNLLAAFSLSVFGTILVFALVQATKHARYAAYDLSRLLPSWFGTGEGLILLLIVVVSPLMFGFGVAPVAVLAIAMVYAYQSAQERRVSTVALGALALAPTILYVAASLVTFHGSIADTLETAMTEAFAREADEELVEYAKNGGREDLDSALVLAYRYRMRGDLGAAEVEYRRALAAAPHHAVARNNLGTLLYLLGHDEQAMATFREAAARGERVEPWLNLASILVDNSSFDEANAAIEAARKIDPDVTERYARMNADLPTVQRLFDASLEQSVLWSRLFQASDEQLSDVSDELWSAIGGTMPPMAMPIFVLAAFLLALLLAKNSDRIGLCVGCPKCGVPAQRDAPAEYCDQCQSIFLKAIAVDPVLRFAKEGAVRRYQRRRRGVERALGLIAGAGHVFSGKPVTGIVMLFGFGCALIGIAWPDGIVVHPWSLGADVVASQIRVMTFSATAVVLIALSIRQVFK